MTDPVTTTGGTVIPMPKTSDPVVLVDETYFAPYSVPDPAQALIAWANKATTSIHIDIYGFTYAPLMDALIAAHQRGVTVNIVCDHSQASGPAEKVQLQRLVDAGIALLVTTSSRGGIDHSKYLIVDAELGPMAPESVVLFGSFNFSQSALAQDNTLAARGAAELVAVFLANWQRVYADGVGRHPEWQLKPTGA